MFPPLYDRQKKLFELQAYSLKDETIFWDPILLRSIHTLESALEESCEKMCQVVGPISIG